MPIMRTVEIRLPPSELPTRMAAMRVWLDEHRFEPAVFACDEEAASMRLAVSFAEAAEAEAFAGRFDGRMQGTLAAVDQDLERDVLPPADLVG